MYSDKMIWMGTVLVVVFVPQCLCINQPLALGQPVRPGHYINTQHSTENAEVVREHEAQYEGTHNGQHRAPSYGHNNQVYNLNTAREQAVIPTSPRTLLFPTPSIVNNARIDHTDRLPVKEHTESSNLKFDVTKSTEYEQSSHNNVERISISTPDLLQTSYKIHTTSVILNKVTRATPFLEHTTPSQNVLETKLSASLLRLENTIAVNFRALPSERTDIILNNRATKPHPFHIAPSATVSVYEALDISSSVDVAQHRTTSAASTFKDKDVPAFLHPVSHTSRPRTLPHEVTNSPLPTTQNTNRILSTIDITQINKITAAVENNSTASRTETRLPESKSKFESSVSTLSFTSPRSLLNSTSRSTTRILWISNRVPASTPRIPTSTSGLPTSSSSRATGAPIPVTTNIFLALLTSYRLTTKRQKYVSKDYTIDTRQNTTLVSLPSSARTSTQTSTNSPTTNRPTTSRNITDNNPRHSPTFLRLLAATSTSRSVTRRQIGFIGSSTKAPLTTTNSIKSITYPTEVQVLNTISKLKHITLTPRTSSTESRRETTTQQDVTTTSKITKVTNITLPVVTERNLTLSTTGSTVSTAGSPVSTTGSTVSTAGLTDSHIALTNVTHTTTTAHIRISTITSAPPVFVTVRLRMSWSVFCVNAQSFQRELVDILETNFRNSFRREQVMIMNEEIKYCIGSKQVVEQTEIYVKLYIVDYHGEYDSSLTVECAQFIETGFHEESFFKDKLIRVTLNTADEKKETNNKTPSPPLYAAPPDLGVTIAITIAAIGGFCCISVIILQIIIRRRYSKSRTSTSAGRRRCSVTSNDTIALASVKPHPLNGLFNPALDINHFVNNNGNLTNPVDFTALVNVCHDVESIYEEFYVIQNEMSRLPSVPKGAEDKNRYSNVIPTPKTRVKLKRKVSQPHSDYINANFITGYPDEKKVFIATQAPLPYTKDDFWRMVWEQQCRVIVMLTGLEENGQSKCCTYWPDSPQNLMKFGDFTVLLKNKDVTQEYIISTLELKDIENNLLREIKHVWYTSWTFKTLPDPVSLIKFVLDVRYLYEDSGGPLVVHCSPGTGRTGTLLAVDICSRQYETEQVTDILKCVAKLRKERVGLVQTKQQYALIYQAVYEYALFLKSPSISAASSVMTLHQVRL